MTLVEIVAALVLAAGVLGTALLAYGRSLRQERTARDRLRAIDVADQLLAGWLAPGGTPPLPDGRRRTPMTGAIEEQEGWQWRISPLPDAARATADAPFAVKTYRLQIVAAAEEKQAERTLVSVDFVGTIIPQAVAGGGGLRWR